MKKKVAISITIELPTLQQLMKKAEKERKPLSQVIQEILEKNL